MKILIYGDYYKFKSGYAREIRDVLPYLKKGNDVRQIALGYNGYPIDQDMVVYHTKTPEVKNHYAQEVLHYAIDDFQPDIVLTVQDFWILPKISFTLAHPGKFKWVHWGTCLEGNTEILMGNGSTRTIKDIVDNKINEEVICFNPKEKVFIKSRITNWYKNSATKKDWYRIYFRNSIDKSCITITGDHPLLTNHGWKKVKEIRPDEKVFRFDKKITISGQQALLGMFIGDGWVENNGSRFCWAHTKPQKNYLLDTAKKFGANIKISKPTKSSFTKNDVYTARFSLKRICPELIKLFTKRQKISKELLNKLDTIGLAYWYMDDGCLRKSKKNKNWFRPEFATNSFSKKELHLIQEFFLQKFDIKTTLYKTKVKNQFILAILPDYSETFFRLIIAYIHKDLLYKIPNKYRKKYNHGLGCIEFIKFISKGLKSTGVTIRKLTSYSPSEISKKRIDIKNKYNIETENYHTYIANGYIAHNCDAEPLDFYSRESLKWMHYCFWQSHFGAIECKRILPGLMGEVIYPSVDPKIFHKLDKEKLKRQFKLSEFNVLICNARGQQRKNVPILLDAFKQVIKEIPNTTLILSSGIERTKTDSGEFDGYDLERFVHELGLVDYVILPRTKNRGPINDETLNIQYNLADLNILASWGEGFGLPFIEAGASSVPSIGIDHSAVHEIVLNRGSLVKPRAYAYNLDGSRYQLCHPDDLKDAIVKLLKDEKLREKYGKAAAEFAKKLTPESRAKLMLDRFKKLIKDDAQPAARR